MSKAFADQGLVVAPPIDLKQGWNLGKPSLFLLLLGLSLAGRIAIVWLSPPATTFSLARPQKLRSRDQPLGFDLLNIDVLLGNFHIHLALALWLAQWFCGRFAVLATPWTALVDILSEVGGSNKPLGPVPFWNSVPKIHSAFGDPFVYGKAVPKVSG